MNSLDVITARDLGADYAGIYTSADGRSARIAYEGKGRSIPERRSFYASSTEPNIFTSAPMLIENHVPVGASFAGYFTSAKDLEKYDYEDHHRHQGVRHPRSAVAVTDNGHLLLVVVDGCINLYYYPFPEQESQFLWHHLQFFYS